MELDVRAEDNVKVVDPVEQKINKSNCVMSRVEPSALRPKQAE
jgi:hypothetical protein